MKLLFDALWMLACIALLTMAFWGFRTNRATTKTWAVIGAVVAAMVAAGHGFVVLAPYFYMFPTGLYPGLAQLFASIPSDAQRVPGSTLVIGWLAYGILACIYILVSRPAHQHIAWTLLLTLLGLNIAGCHPLISTIEKVP